MQFLCNFPAFLCNFGYIFPAFLCKNMEANFQTIWHSFQTLYISAFKPCFQTLYNSVCICMCMRVCRYAGIHVSMYTCIQLFMYTIIHNHNATLINFTNLHHKIICRKNVKKNILTIFFRYCIIVNVKRFTNKNKRSD